MLERLTSRLSRVLALRPAERRLLLASSVLLPLFWLGLQALGLRRFHALLARTPAGSDPAAADQARPMAALVNTAARYTPFGATCLTRSLLLEWLLRRRGIAGNMRIGVRLAQGTLEAHAWVECDGAPVNDDAQVARDFAAFDPQSPACSLRVP